MRNQLLSLSIALSAMFVASCASRQGPQPTSQPGPQPTSPPAPQAASPPAAPSFPPPSAPAAASPASDLGMQWVRYAAEYQASAKQAYASAAQDLDRMIADKSWSALPGQPAVAGRKPAIIFDIDETVVNNVQFQVELVPPFSESKFDEWHRTHESVGVPGAAGFVERASAAGVELFYVTNRSCVPAADSSDPCPQERIALDDLREAGITADPQHVLLSDEKPEWTQEKQVRRDFLGANYRVIMLFGDDLGDFLPCVRKRVYAPCTAPATRESRLEQTEKYGGHWGNGWYVLPNPMYGSWTSTR